MRRICEGVGSEASQALISFGLGESSLRPWTLREAKVIGFSIIGETISSGWLVDRSQGLVGGARWGILSATIHLSFLAEANGAIHPQGL